MVKERLIWMVGGSMITIAIFILAQQFFFGSTSAEHLTEDEAKAVVLSTYQGNVEEVQDEGSSFSIKIELDNGIYLVKVDKASGDVLDIQLLEPKEVAVKDEQPSPPSKNNNNHEPDNVEEEIDQEPETNEDEQIKMINKEDAEKVATEDTSGLVTNNILVENEETPYYDIEIENDDDIISFQIDAYTGAVLYKESQRKDLTFITKEEAIKIALSKVNGEIDDIEIKDINGVLYFIIEIETEEDHEAIVQIHSITGQTTITWDLGDDDDD